MPVPRNNEKKNDFIKRCIIVTRRDGAAKNTNQAVAICNDIWDRERYKDGTKLK